MRAFRYVELEWKVEAAAKESYQFPAKIYHIALNFPNSFLDTKLHQ